MPLNWKVVQDVNNKKFSNGDFIGVVDDHYVIHDHNSSDLVLISNLNDLDFATLDVDGQSTKVKAPPPITKKMILLMMKMTFLMIKDNEVLINSDDDEVATIIYSSDEED
ncbi:hypothetical protein Tco_0372136 [Tanacetum coccineum]